MKNVTGKIHRSPKQGKVRYTPIFNDALQNTELSFRARGLLVYILSLPLDWIPVKNQIMRKNNYKRTKFDAIWNELKEAGYIHSKRIKNDLGQYVGWEHLVLESPTFVKSDIQEILHSEKDTLTKERDIQKKDDIKKKDLNKQYSNSTKEVAMDTSFNKSSYDFYIPKERPDVTVQSGYNFIENFQKDNGRLPTTKELYNYLNY